MPHRLALHLKKVCKLFWELSGYLVGVSTQCLQTWVWVGAALPQPCLLSAEQSRCLECKDEVFGHHNPRNRSRGAGKCVSALEFVQYLIECP